MARLHIAAGRADGVRAADIVGAITNGAGLEGWAIGAVKLLPHAATVEVPADVAAEIVRALARQSIRGKRVAIKVID